MINCVKFLGLAEYEANSGTPDQIILYRPGQDSWIEAGIEIAEAQGREAVPDSGQPVADAEGGLSG